MTCLRPHPIDKGGSVGKSCQSVNSHMRLNPTHMSQNDSASNTWHVTSAAMMASTDMSKRDCDGTKSSSRLLMSDIIEAVWLKAVVQERNVDALFWSKTWGN